MIEVFIAVFLFAILALCVLMYVTQSRTMDKVYTDLWIAKMDAEYYQGQTIEADSLNRILKNEIRDVRTKLTKLTTEYERLSQYSDLQSSQLSNVTEDLQDTSRQLEVVVVERNALRVDVTEITELLDEAKVECQALSASLKLSREDSDRAISLNEKIIEYRAMAQSCLAAKRPNMRAVLERIANG